MQWQDLPAAVCQEIPLVARASAPQDLAAAGDSTSRQPQPRTARDAAGTSNSAESQACEPTLLLCLVSNCFLQSGSLNSLLADMVEGALPICKSRDLKDNLTKVCVYGEQGSSAPLDRSAAPQGVAAAGDSTAPQPKPGTRQHAVGTHNLAESRVQETGLLLCPVSKCFLRNVSCNSLPADIGLIPTMSLANGIYLQYLMVLQLKL